MSLRIVFEAGSVSQKNVFPSLFRVLHQVNGGGIGKLCFRLFIGEVEPGMMLLELLASNGLGRTCWMFAMILSPLFLGECSMGCLLPTPRYRVIPLRKCL